MPCGGIDFPLTRATFPRLQHYFVTAIFRATIERWRQHDNSTSNGEAERFPHGAPWVPTRASVRVHPAVADGYRSLIQETPGPPAFLLIEGPLAARARVSD
jgi:hypothetical protein